MDLSGKQILIGMTGGIAAYKVCELVRRLQDEGARINVAMTRGAQQFVTTTTMQALTGTPVFTDQWGTEGGRVADAMPHIALTRGTDAVLIAPCSAHFIAKLAQGLCDDLLSTLAIARNCPLLIAPAMNVEMWDHPATQRNLEILRRDGVHILGPGVGDQACGETGAGRMLEPDQLLAEIAGFFQPKVLQGRRVLVTAGPTFEPIDPVRGITNLSSGKMGYALARAAREAGARVTLISGPSALPSPHDVRRIDVTTAGEMLDAVMGYVNRADVFIAVAAVADWRVTNASPSKIKKSVLGAPPALQFEPNPDILATVAALPNAPYCVGFAAETDDILANAGAKRIAKGIPLLVANRAQDAMGADETALSLVDETGVIELARASKIEQARLLVSAIAQRLVRAGEHR